MSSRRRVGQIGSFKPCCGIRKPTICVSLQHVLPAAFVEPHLKLSSFLSPPESYPKIRLPIKGVRGALGTVYHKHGVFYEGVGSDEYVLEDGPRIMGAYIDNEWGQTGANSSMYKWFDLFCGVTQARQAYSADPISLSKMAAVFEGRMDSGQLGDNPIDSMQRAFDLFTRQP
jgi:hypothetical protein